MTTLMLSLLGVLSVVQRQHGPAAEDPDDARLPNFRVVGNVELVEDHDPKFPEPRVVHVVEGETFEVFARTMSVKRLDVAVQLTGRDGFGVFSGEPDRYGFVRVAVTVPEAGSQQSVTVPGPEGRRTPWEVPAGTAFMLVPSGVVSDGSPGGHFLNQEDEIVVRGDRLWVRVRD